MPAEKVLFLISLHFDIAAFRKHQLDKLKNKSKGGK